MAQYVRKHLAFNTAKEKQAVTADFLELVGKKKSEFISDLVYGFLRDNGIEDVSHLTNKEAHGLIKSADVKREVIKNEEMKDMFGELLKLAKKQQRKLNDIEHSVKTGKISKDSFSSSEEDMVHNEPVENSFNSLANKDMVHNEPSKGANMDNIEETLDEDENLELDLDAISNAFKSLM